MRRGSPVLKPGEPKVSLDLVIWLDGWCAALRPHSNKHNTGSIKVETAPPRGPSSSTGVQAHCTCAQCNHQPQTQKSSFKTAAAAQVEQLKAQRTKQASNAAAYQQAAAVQVAQLKAQLAEQASTAAACQQAAVAQGAQLKAAHRQARGASFLRFDYEQAAAQVGHLKVQLTEQALSAAACQQAAAAQVAQLRAEQLETILLLAKQLETTQIMRDIWAEDLVKFCSKIHVKLHKCEDAHDEMSERKRFRAYGKLHDFITTHTDYLCSTVLAD